MLEKYSMQQGSKPTAALSCLDCRRVEIWRNRRSRREGTSVQAPKAELGSEVRRHVRTSRLILAAAWLAKKSVAVQSDADAVAMASRWPVARTPMWRSWRRKPLALYRYGCAHCNRLPMVLLEARGP